MATAGYRGHEREDRDGWMYGAVAAVDWEGVSVSGRAVGLAVRVLTAAVPIRVAVAVAGTTPGCDV
jgi:hypothetical protein